MEAAVLVESQDRKELESPRASIISFELGLVGIRKVDS